MSEHQQHGGGMFTTEGVGALKLPDGCKCQKSISQNFGFYDPPIIEAAQKESFEERFLPINGLDSDPYEFNIETVGDTFLHMDSMYLYLQAKIVKGDGGNIAAGANVALANCAISTIWKTVELKLNNVTVNPASSYNIAHKSYIENLLTYDGDDYNVLRAGGWQMDTAGKHDVMGAANKGFTDRKALAKESKLFDLCGRIPCDFLYSDNHLAPGNRLTLRFTKNADSFIINSDDAAKEYKLKITQMAVYGRRIRLTPEALSKIWKPNQTQRYLTSYTEMKEYPLAAGVSSFTTKLYAGGKLPKSIIIAQVETAALVGSYTRNPLTFNHQNIQKINLKLNGTRIPQDVLEMDFNKGLIQRAFQHIFMNTGKYNTNSSNSITSHHFKDGCTIFPFDLTPDQCNRYHTHGGYDGTLELEITWSAALPQGVTIMTLASSDQIVYLSPKSSPQVVVF